MHGTRAQAKTLQAADTRHVGICVRLSEDRCSRGALCGFTYVDVGPSEASQRWMPPWVAGESTPTWQKCGQHTKGGEVLSISVFDAGILLMDYECGIPTSTNVEAVICVLGPACKPPSSSARGGLGWVPLALEEAGDVWLVQVPTFCYFSQNF